METAHLATLGARPLPRTQFRALLDRLVADGPAPGHWPSGAVNDAFRRN